ncbi:MAG: acyl-CoA dehydrogenase [SAR86 cluster bacterium]|uniref:3-methylmercaptopropionyl-CoA dehydrogenase n=1 Tax=SAR86 cluster bacterium TaxID=2030880 RepID=A0A2A5B8V4_9GAMM|nr:MAG: acyl-CoA dehydrogenase [SAR86 cluster bacterium]
MPEYKAPLRDMQFAFYEVLQAEQHYQRIGAEDASRDMVDAILGEGSKFAEEVLSPLNRVGDEQGCKFEDGQVTTPAGFKQAYKQFVEGGWPSLAGETEYGGQGLPESLATVLNEMVSTANWSWGMYPGLSHGAKLTLSKYGSEEQKQTYLSKLTSGEWTGTMCLTEAQCGTDLGLLKTKAEPNADGSFRISGSKIFISAGDHDMTENIVHIVLARLPDAPGGTRGISLFIVPKMSVEDGSTNNVSCGSIEHKMGIHGNATAVLNFDEATGYLIGPENGGLKCMFTFMNFARLGTAMQGVASAELSFQGALAYAQDRLAMRSLAGPKFPEKPADPIIVHPDVRRMLLTQKCIAEGGRVFIYFCAMQGDILHSQASEEEKAEAEALMNVLTPIAKAFLTETGYEAANYGMQIFGGHGYIAEWGMEQIVRDARISMLYEGTTGIQALDLLGRKVLSNRGESLRFVTRIMHRFCRDNETKGMQEFIKPLRKLYKEWGGFTTKLGLKAMRKPEEVGGASVDYLMYSGYVTLAYFWAAIANTAMLALQDNTISKQEKAYYESKIKTARFYYKRILPRTRSHKEIMFSGVKNLMDLDADHFRM